MTTELNSEEKKLVVDLRGGHFNKQMTLDTYINTVAQRLRNKPGADELLGRWGVGLGTFRECYEQSLGIQKAANRIYKQLQEVERLQVNFMK